MSEYTDLVRNLEELGIRKGGVLLVHSSYKSLGTSLSPGLVIEGLLDAIGPQGCLLMPALSYKYVTGDYPHFNVCHTPSNVGILPETFRNRSGVLRSLHPTHSVCGLGKSADEILGSHSLDGTPCGEHSPFRLLPDYEGQILFLGCGLNPNTSMHAIEELVQPDYLFGEDQVYVLTDNDGKRSSKAYRTHGFQRWVQRYDRIGRFLEEPSLRRGDVLHAHCHLLEAKSLWTKAIEIYKTDSHAFVERES